MKRTFILIPSLILFLSSCVENAKQQVATENKDTIAVQKPEPEAKDRSEFFIGTWIDRKTLEYPMRGHIAIEKSGTRFLVRCSDFRTWDGVNGLNGETLIATYDKTNDKLVVSFGSFTREIFYNDSDGSLIDGSNTLIPMAYDAN